MAHRVHVAVLATTLVVLACSSPVEVPGGLQGQWATVPLDLSPQGWYQSHLTFTSTGSYTSEVRTYGLYTEQGSTELSAFSREEGHFAVEGDRLIMEAQRLVVWDRFYGADSPERVYEPYPYGDAPFDGARFANRGDRLTLHYMTYPADAPVPTTKEYALVR